MAVLIVKKEEAVIALVSFLLLWGNVVADKPKVEPFLFPRKPEAGATIRVLCSVSQGDLPLSITWLHNGKKIARDNVEIKHLDEMSKSIKIVSLDVRDIGNYTCVATNSAGFDSYTLPLKFQGPPKWKSAPPGEMDILSGNVISLSCEASGYPYPVITWHYGPSCKYIKPSGSKLPKQMVEDTFFVDFHQTGDCKSRLKMIPILSVLAWLNLNILF